MNTISVGIDLSLTGTGLVATKDGKMSDKKLIKSKPGGSRPLDEIRRIKQIKEEIIKFLVKNQPKVVVIEGLAFMARNTTALVQLAGLNYLVRDYLEEEGTNFLIVAPTTLKKFITGKGNAQKDQMMLETYKRYRVSFDDDNLCDGFGLAQVGQACVNDKFKTTGAQREVIQLLIKQI
jgi:crossover junction endodeoxyribonuclease RuvC